MNSVTKEFLANEANYTAETMARLSHPDPEMRAMLAPHIIRERMVCADGFRMSVQFSRFHYCNAREPLLGGEWRGEGHPLPEPHAVEVGFPNRREPLLAEYAEEPKRLTKTVYGWVPVEVVDAVIAKHGGLK